MGSAAPDHSTLIGYGSRSMFPTSHHEYGRALMAQSSAFNTSNGQTDTPSPFAQAVEVAVAAFPLNQEANDTHLSANHAARQCYSNRPEALPVNGVDLEATPPFQPATYTAQYLSLGVVKIKNIPFTVSAQEIAQFINKFAVVSMVQKSHECYPIHIIMEKPTGKTMDCFVEFPDVQAAKDCVRRFDDTSHAPRDSRLGGRNVDMEVSSQAELMRAVFPLARLVDFDHATGEPTILSPYHGCNWSSGFRGYFTLEEIYGLTRFAEVPSRSPFVLKCHQRVYECMISTLYKFPWPATATYTVAARDALFESVYRQLKILNRKVGCPVGPAADTNLVLCNSQHGTVPGVRSPFIGDGYEVRMHSREVGLSQSLLYDLLFASINVPAFSLLQKRALCEAVESRGWNMNISSFLDTWPFQTLVPTPDSPNSTIKFWLELFHKGFDYMQHEGLETTFEKWLVFNRNGFGLPIAEWTRQGIELPFGDAVRVERAAMMSYVIRGRTILAIEHQLLIQHWQPEVLADLIETMTVELQSGHPITQNAPREHSTSESLSPQTTENATELRVEQVGAIGGPSLNKEGRRDSKLKNTTAPDLVPSQAYIPHAIQPLSASYNNNSRRPFSSCIELGFSTPPHVVNPFPPVSKVNLGIDTKAANLFRNPFLASDTEKTALSTRKHSTDTQISPREIINSDLSDSLAATHLGPRRSPDLHATGPSRPNPFSTAPTRPQHTPFTTDNPSSRDRTVYASTIPSTSTRGSNSFSSGSVVQHNPASFSRINDVFSTSTLTTTPPSPFQQQQPPPARRATATGMFGPIGSGLPLSSTTLPGPTNAHIIRPAFAIPSIPANLPASAEHRLSDDSPLEQAYNRSAQARTLSVQDSSLRGAGRDGDRVGSIGEHVDRGVAVTRAGSWTGSSHGSIWGGYGLGSQRM